MKTKLLLLIGSISLLLLASCAQNLPEIPPDYAGWCHVLNLADEAVALDFIAGMRTGLGAQTDDDVLSVTYTHPTIIEPDMIEVYYVVDLGLSPEFIIDSSHMVVDFNAFGIADSFQTTVDERNAGNGSYGGRVQVAGTGGTDATINIVTDGAKVTIKSLKVAGNTTALNPFGSNNCTDEDDNTPTPTLTTTPPEIELPTALPTSSPTPTPSDTPIPDTAYWSEWYECSYSGGIENGYNSNDFNECEIPATGGEIIAVEWQITGNKSGSATAGGGFGVVNFKINQREVYSDQQSLVSGSGCFDTLNDATNTDINGSQCQSIGYPELAINWGINTVNPIPLKIGVGAHYYTINADVVGRIRYVLNGEYPIPPSPTATPLGTETNTPSPTPTITPTWEDDFTPSPYPTQEPYPTQTAYPTYTPFPSSTIGPLPTYTYYPTYTALPGSTDAGPDSTGTAAAEGTQSSANATGTATGNNPGDGSGDGAGDGAGLGGRGGSGVGLGSGINFIDGAMSWLMLGINLPKSFLTTWKTTTPQSPPGLPDCVDHPIENEICAVYYILEYTLFAKTGALIIPLITTAIDIAILAQVITYIRTIARWIREITIT